MIKITTTLHIAENEIEETFVRSPGPGGQHVNKVSTSVQLRFDAKNSSAISSSMLQRLRILAGRKITKSGILIITSHRHRSQLLNREAALNKLVSLVEKAAVVQKIRHATRPSKASQKRRLESKKRLSDTKKNRGPVRLSKHSF